MDQGISFPDPDLTDSTPGAFRKDESGFEPEHRSTKTDSVDESSFLHLFFLDCEKYRERNFLVKMLFDLRKLVCAK